VKTEHAYILLLGGAILTVLGAIMTTITLYRLGRPYAEVTDHRLTRLLFFIVLLFAGFVAIAFALATSAKAQADLDTHVVCTSVGGPIQIGTDKPVSVPLKCCPAGSFISDPQHPVDANGNLICYREKT
jgi:hypothetical protein